MAAAVYVTPDGVRSLLCPDVTRVAGTAATLSDATLAERISTAQTDVDAALASSGHRTPQQGPAPQLVRDVTAAIAAWLADLTYRQGKAHESQLDPVVQRYGWAQALLTQWAKGVRLPAGIEPITDGAGATGGDLQIGAPINPNGDTALLTGPPAGPSWADADPLYDPDRYRWGHERGWF